MANNRNTFRLGDWLVDPDLCELRASNGETTSVQPKVMDVLLCLVAANGQVVSRQNLIEAVWEGRPTSDEPINRCIAELRAALGDDRANPTYIRTVPKRGYQLLVKPLAPGRSGLRHVPWIYAVIGVALVAGLSWFGLREMTPSAPETPKILVMPLEALDPETDLLAKALTEELLNSLTQAPDMLVYSRTTTFSMPAQGPEAMAAARRIGANYVLEGAMRLDEDNLRITAQLVDVDTDIHLFSREFAVQKEQASRMISNISRAIASQVGKGLPASGPRARLHDLDFAAYRDFIEAEHLHHIKSRSSMQEALSRLKNVLERYPDFAPAHARIAGVYATYYYGIERVPGYRELRDQHIERALEINPDEPYALAVKVLGEPHAEVIRVYRKAIAADSRFHSLRYVLGQRLARAGYLDAALRELEWAARREPTMPRYNFHYALMLAAENDWHRFEKQRLLLDDLGEDSLASWFVLLRAIIKQDADSAARAWPAIQSGDWLQEFAGTTKIDVDATLLESEDIRNLVLNASSGQRCLLVEDEEMARTKEGLHEFWKFLFMSPHRECTDQVLALDFGQIGAAPNWEVPMLLWMPHLAHLRSDPRFVEFTRKFELPGIWDELGPPDLCERQGDEYRCH